MTDAYISLLVKYNSLKETTENLEASLKATSEKVLIADQAKTFLIGFSEHSRERIKTKLENVVNSALSSIFIDKDLKFKIFPNNTKKGIVYDIYLETNGILTPIEDCKGGGVLDIVSMALRIAFVRLFSNKIRQLMLLDEPFKNLDSQRIVLAVAWLKTVSKEFGIQFVMVSHEDAIVDNSDIVYRVTQVDNVSKVEKING